MQPVTPISINRTLVELKLVYGGSGLSTSSAINRTLVELKLGFKIILRRLKQAINRTLVELKHEHGIVLGLAFVYQSYLSGIKTIRIYRITTKSMTLSIVP